ELFVCSRDAVQALDRRADRVDEPIAEGEREDARHVAPPARAVTAHQLADAIVEARPRCALPLAAQLDELAPRLAGPHELVCPDGKEVVSGVSVQKGVRNR